MFLPVRTGNYRRGDSMTHARITGRITSLRFISQRLDEQRETERRKEEDPVVTPDAAALKSCEKRSLSSSEDSCAALLTPSGDLRYCTPSASQTPRSETVLLSLRCFIPIVTIFDFTSLISVFWFNFVFFDNHFKYRCSQKRPMQFKFFLLPNRNRWIKCFP